MYNKMCKAHIGKIKTDAPYLKSSSKRLSNNTTSQSLYKGESNSSRCPRVPHVKQFLSCIAPFSGRDRSPLKKFEKYPDVVFIQIMSDGIQVTNVQIGTLFSIREK